MEYLDIYFQLERTHRYKMHCNSQQAAVGYNAQVSKNSSRIKGQTAQLISAKVDIGQIIRRLGNAMVATQKSICKARNSSHTTMTTVEYWQENQ